MDLSFCLKINNGYAMKKILKIEENKIDDMEIKIEIDILQILDHLNIVKIFEFIIILIIILLSLNFINMENNIVLLKKMFRKIMFYFIKFFLVYVIYMKIILFIKILNQKI